MSFPSLNLHANNCECRYMVHDVDAAIAWYTKHLGFTVLSNYAPALADVTLGSLRLLLSGPTSSAGRPMPDGARPEAGGWNREVLNANLRMELGSPWWAGFISYLIGTLVMLAVAVTSGQPWLSEAMTARTSWITWTGGLFGAIFIATAILMVPRLGAATVLALIVVGEMLASLVFDHFGLLDLPQHRVGLPRLAGTAFLILGVVLIRA